MVFCNEKLIIGNDDSTRVTILILIDGFLQLNNINWSSNCYSSHNPYFNRWFSAM